ncbi:MAG: hypothetical protein AB7P33_04965 [Dehalococcoidia bacterium]
MAELVAAAATSHAFTLRSPEQGWDDARINNQKMFEKKFGYFPETPKGVEEETDEDITHRYKNVSSGHETIIQRLSGLDLDAIILIGNDQDEEFGEQSIAPQLAIFTGNEFTTRAGVTFKGKPELAYHLLSGTVNDGFDVTRFEQLDNGVLKAHAFGPVIERLTPEADVPVIPVYVESFRLPCPSPARCYAFGQSLRKAVEAWPGNQRIGVIASGGISHFPQSFPFQYSAEAKHGNVDHVYDRKLFEFMKEGRYDELTKLSNQDLLDHGDTELHSWITLLGMVGDVKTEVLAYEPFFRAIMAMGVAYWDLQGAAVS